MSTSQASILGLYFRPGTTPASMNDAGSDPSAGATWLRPPNWYRIVGSSENGPERQRPSRPTVWRSSLMPFRQLRLSFGGDDEVFAFWNHVVALMPPRL